MSSVPPRASLLHPQESWPKRRLSPHVKIVLPFQRAIDGSGDTVASSSTGKSLEATAGNGDRALSPRQMTAGSSAAATAVFCSRMHWSW